MCPVEFDRIAGKHWRNVRMEVEVGNSDMCCSRLQNVLDFEPVVAKLETSAVNDAVVAITIVSRLNVT